MAENRQNGMCKIYHLFISLFIFDLHYAIELGFFPLSFYGQLICLILGLKDFLTRISLVGFNGRQEGLAKVTLQRDLIENKRIGRKWNYL